MDAVDERDGGNVMGNTLPSVMFAWILRERRCERDHPARARFFTSEPWSAAQSLRLRRDCRSSARIADVSTGAVRTREASCLL